MKSIDKFVLVLVASLALLLAGCGGGSSTSEEPTDPPAVDPAVAERAAISSAIMMARTAVSGVGNDSTDSEVSAADTAIESARTAIANAANVPAAEKAANTTTVDTLASQLSSAKMARSEAMGAADKAAAEAMAKVGKALRAALTGPTPASTNALNNLELPPGFADGDLTIDAAAGAGTLEDAAAHDSVNLEAGDSAGSLGGWTGTDYAHSTGTGDNKVSNEARVYTNKGPGKREAFADALPSGVTIADANAGGAAPAQITDLTTAIKGYIPVATGGTVTTGLDIGKVMANAFTHDGTQNHAISGTANSFTTRGTYDGASGEYRCVTGCSSTNDDKGAPSALGGTWFFKPDAGAMVLQPDEHYLFYGWWVRKDNDGDPTAASAFAGRAGTDPADSTDGLDPGWSGAYVSTAGSETITGSASYAGNAVGKFSMSNALDGTGNGGHFTADASLTAKFSGTGSGVNGTIDNFRLNDGSDDPGWSVTLHRASFGSDGAISAPVDDSTTTDVNEAMGTTWSVDGNSGGRSGTWSGQMYDEMPGNAPDGDGSNIPTTATGTFYSSFSANGRMVGAFGADKE